MTTCRTLFPKFVEHTAAQKPEIGVVFELLLVVFGNSTGGKDLHWCHAYAERATKSDTLFL